MPFDWDTLKDTPDDDDAVRMQGRKRPEQWKFYPEAIVAWQKALEYWREKCRESESPYLTSPQKVKRRKKPLCTAKGQS